MINSNRGHISGRLATTAQTDLQGHPRPMIFLCHLKANMRRSICD